jgi:hypothetical protein
MSACAVGRTLRPVRCLPTSCARQLQLQPSSPRKSLLTLYPLKACEALPGTDVLALLKLLHGRAMRALTLFARPGNEPRPRINANSNSCARGRHRPNDSLEARVDDNPNPRDTSGEENPLRVAAQMLVRVRSLAVV